MPPLCQDLFETLMQSAPGGNMEGLMGQSLRKCWSVTARMLLGVYLQRHIIAPPKLP